MTIRRPLVRLLASVVVLLTIAPGVYPQSIDQAAIDRIMDEGLARWQVPGASIAIVRGADVAYLKGFGVREFGKPDLVTPDTLFGIGSTTKAFTTTAIAMLVEDGRMKWDDHVRQYVGFFKLADPLADQNVTVRDLVSHRTGLSRHDVLWARSPWSREEIIRKIGEVPLSKPFRTTYQYQNIMFLVAGYAAGRASNGSWEQLVQSRILDPLGMTGTNFSSLVAEKVADRAIPHGLGPDGRITVGRWLNFDNVAPAGTINSSARDMSKWLRFLLGGGTYDGKRLLAEEALWETFTPQTVIRVEGQTRATNPFSTQMSYGLGWFVQDYRGHLMISHTGSLNGFRARVILIPKEKLGIVVLMNSGVGLSPASMHVAVTNQILDLLLKLPSADWHALLRAEAKKAEDESRAELKRIEEGRQRDTKPSRPLSAYAGDYEAPGYGVATVALEDGALTVSWGSSKNRLEHFHFDTFRAKGPGPLDNERLTFVLNADAAPAAVELLGTSFQRVRSR